MTIYETDTALAPSEVVARARSFFELAFSPYAAFAEQIGDGHLRLRLEVGEVVIGALRNGGSTRVRGSASRGAHLLTQFLASIAPPEAVRQQTNRHGRER